MKKINQILSLLVAIFLVVTINNACTNLDEDYGSTITPDAFGNTAVSIRSLYATLASGGFAGAHNSYWSDQEVSSDEVLVPQRGGDWYDGGQWIRMHQHDYNANEGSFSNTWNNAYGVIASCNRLLVQVKSDDPTVEPELKAVRAMYYYFLLDLFGNVPKITKYPGDLGELGTQSRTEIFNFVVKELTDARDKLTKKSNYGRLNYWAIQGLLAKIYLNAQVYTGTPKWQEAYDAANDIIINGKTIYSLEKDYTKIFSFDNNTSTENILVVPYDETSLQGFNMGQMTLHYSSQSTFNLVSQPWNGYCSLADFYNSYDKNDNRKSNNFLEGQQFTSKGDSVKDSGNKDKPLAYNPVINELFPNANRDAGVRIFKYHFKPGSTQNLSNDYPLVRLGEMYLIRAESKLRGANGPAVALDDVNELRPRTGLAKFTTITLDDLYKERGKEMFAEGVRRSDMIRFGTYFKPYDKFKTSTDAPTKGLMPVPQSQIDVNSKLVQNPGY